MKAVKLTGPRKLELVEEQEPRPGGDNAVIRVSACGICGSDLHYWEMGTGMDGEPGLIPGHEFCGIVEDPGPAKDLNPGDRVTYIPLNPCGQCSMCKRDLRHLCPAAFRRMVPGNNAPGAFAEKVGGRADMFRKIPDSMSDEEACLVEPAAVALHAVRQAGVSIGDKVLVMGGGAIGLLCAAWTKAAGAGFAGICEINPGRIENARSMQFVDEVFDAGGKKLKRNLKQASDGGFDSVLETSAAEAGIAAAVSALLPRGTLILAGISFVPQTVSTLMLTSKELAVKGSMAYSVEEFETALEFIASKRLEARGLINRVLGFGDLWQAFEELDKGNADIVKAVVRP
ncbi:MAG: zinc-dependent alcohol dehydrogenase [Desulfosalsimonas sp.]